MDKFLCLKVKPYKFINMKLLIAIITLFITFNISGQNPLDKNVGEFDTVKVYDLIEVNLIKSSENKVVITGDDAENVEVFNQKNVLKIRMKIDQIFNGNKTIVAVHYTDLKTIDGNEGAYITSNELIVQDDIELKAQEGARLKIDLDVNKVEIRSVTGGIIETKGKAKTQVVTLNTGGIYVGRAFETISTDVSIKAAGEADVNASETVNAKIRAGGDVNIYGNPKTVNKDTAFGGRIKVME